MRTLTVVIPVFNEEESIATASEQVASALDSLEGWQSEVIWVDDGSSDASFDLLKKIAANDPRNRVIRFRRNFGQTAALAAGFEHATGSIIVTLDADLQNDPADIASLLAKLDEGYDIVNGWRRRRRDTFVTRVLPSRFANWLISRVTGVHLHDYGCTLKAYRADVARNLSLRGELHRFIPALASWYGVDVAEVEVNHRPRLHGSSKYGMGRTIRVLVDLMTVKFFLGYAGRPGHLFGLLGLALSGGGGIVLGYLGVQRIFFGVPLANRPSLLLGVLLIVLGLQFVGIGLLAEMIVRAAHEGPALGSYVIREQVGEPGHVAEGSPSAGERPIDLGSVTADDVHDASGHARRQE